ncbi:MAG: UDP-N-acetylmuramoyl-L-alanyl-D-glutamate--2,6-diaminopimelate ligase [bacterium]|nr:UDP-N-acetylmuramoyl-L-alanyl-D-glutamate--2,6-diaminopimelate ligase [bacterium]
MIAKFKRSKHAKTLRYVRGLSASVMNQFPASKMTVVGVTGTDGKTTTSNLIFHILKSAGYKVGLISTIFVKIFDGVSDKDYDTGFHVTSPGSFDTQKYLKEMVESGCTHAVVECTSHAFEQERYAGINFNVGVVTNITHEHLDYHKTFEKYVLSKSQLFRIDTRLPDKSIKMNTAIINQDDKAWELFKPYLAGWEVVGYGFNDFCKFHVIDVDYKVDGTNFVFQIEDANGEPVEQYTVSSPMVGDYNVSNLMAAITVCSKAGVAFSDIVKVIPNIPQLSGRFEKFESKNGLVVVDFAHTPNAMIHILTLARQLAKGKIITLFGCAGLRDVQKRKMMGEISGEHSDITIVTSEDPRTENVESIFDLIESGLIQAGSEKYPSLEVEKLVNVDIRASLGEHYPMYIRIDDRKKAIETAIRLGSDGDIILILGKGHEKSMCFGDTEIEWSDQEVVKATIDSL